MKLHHKIIKALGLAVLFWGVGMFLFKEIKRTKPLSFDDIFNGHAFVYFVIALLLALCVYAVVQHLLRGGREKKLRQFGTKYQLEFVSKRNTWSYRNEIPQIEYTFRHKNGDGIYVTLSFSEYSDEYIESTQFFAYVDSYNPKRYFIDLDEPLAKQPGQ